MFFTPSLAAMMTLWRSFFQLGYFFQEHILVKGALRQQNDVRAVAVSPGSQAGGTGQPAGMAAHDLGHRYAADVIHAGITDDLFQDGGNVLGGTAVTGVWSVYIRSLSMVLGTPIKRISLPLAAP